MLTSGLRLPAVSDRFRASIDWALRHPGITIGAVVLIPVFGYMMAGRMSEQFFPPSDRDMINIEVRMPAQSSIERTHAVARSMYQHLETKQGLVSQNWFIGNSAPSYYYNLIFSRDGEPQYANGMIKFTDFERANELIDELQAEFDARWPQAQVLVRKLEQGPPINAPIEIRVFGPSLETLGQVGEDLRKVMSETQGILHSRATLEQARPKLTVNIHEEVSRQAGLELVDIAGQLQTALNGQVQGSVIEGTEELPVRVRLDTGLRQSQEDLESLHIIPALAVAEGDFGGMPLSAIADFSIEPARGAIPRRNGSRVNIIEAYTANGELASDVLARFQENLAASGYSMPSGYPPRGRW